MCYLWSTRYSLITKDTAGWRELDSVTSWVQQAGSIKNWVGEWLFFTPLFMLFFQTRVWQIGHMKKDHKQENAWGIISWSFTAWWYLWKRNDSFMCGFPFRALDSLLAQSSHQGCVHATSLIQDYIPPSSYFFMHKNSFKIMTDLLYYYYYLIIKFTHIIPLKYSPSDSEFLIWSFPIFIISHSESSGSSRAGNACYSLACSAVLRSSELPCKCLWNIRIHKRSAFLFSHTGKLCWQ